MRGIDGTPYLPLRLRVHHPYQRNGNSEAAEEEAAEEKATARTLRRQEQGHVGQSDRDEALPDDTKRENIRQTAQALGLPDAIADTLAARIVADQIKYQFVPADLGSAAFFQVKNRGTGAIHPVPQQRPPRLLRPH